MESFYTIQGEGFHQGKAAYFIRLAGCDVGCTWCDVKESWNLNEHPLQSIDKLVKDASEAPGEIVVITGGEPLMYDLTTLTAELQKAGKKTHVETSGAYPMSGTWDWVCVSPKRFKKALPECLEAADELKVIIAHSNDFRFAQKHKESCKTDCIPYLQPEWSVSDEIVPQIVRFVKEHPEYRICLQAHKFMKVP